VRYLRDVALPLFDAEGRLERYFGVIQDITKTKLAQLRILENKRRFRRLVEHSHDGIAILSTTGEVKYASPSTIRLLGYEPNELLGRQSLDFYLPEERSAAIRAMQAVLQEPSTPVTHRFRIVRRDGAVRWLEAHRSNHCDDPAIDGIVCNFRDVTDSIAAQEAIEASNAKLHKLAQHLQRMREQERANLARELHDELGATLGAIKMYLVDPADAKADWRRGEAVKRVRTLVDNAMAATRRITTNLRPSILDHRGLPAALEWLALELSESTDLRCRVSLESGAMSTLDDNARSAVFRIVQEALRNISQHAQASNVYLLAKRTDGDLIVEVHDDGRGIDSAELGKPTSWGITGMQERAHALGGKLCVQRRPKQGTVVKVRVPLET
jgi:PAS domain S-box-containing protein